MGFILLIELLVSFQISAQNISERLRFTLENSMEGGSLSIRGKHLNNTGEIYRFYAQRNFVPIWSDKGVLNELAYELRFEIRQSKYDGLRPEEYHLGIIDAFFQTCEANKESNLENEIIDLVDLELFLSDAFFLLASHLDRGKVNPSVLKVQWGIPRKPQSINYADLLHESIANQEIRFGFERLYPVSPVYKKGREIIRQLEEILKKDNLSWKPLKTDKSIKVGETNSSIPIIRERLTFWSFLDDNQPDEPKFFDSVMYEAVKKYQLARGMDSDGVLGKLTLSALNESPSDLIEKASVNLERLRWIPNDFFQNELILINIPNFHLDYVTPSDTVFSTKVIVGTSKNPSPVFTAPMSYIVFSPYWNIPPSIARNEVIPAIRRNSNYLSRNNMEVVTSSGAKVSSEEVDWSARSFPYMIRQKPGENNALGLVKFMFPNRFNVYLHDTPGKHLFDQDVRAFSHGCIRMQNPKQLALLLLKGMTEWTPEKIEQAMHQDKEGIVNLKKNIPVLIVYLTFWADSNGRPQFRPDIYNRDEEVRILLRK